MKEIQVHPDTRLVVINADDSLTSEEQALCESVSNQLVGTSKSVVLALAANLIANCIHSRKASERNNVLKAVNKRIREDVIIMLSKQ